MKPIEDLRYQTDVVDTLKNNAASYKLWVDEHSRLIATMYGVNRRITNPLDIKTRCAKYRYPADQIIKALNLQLDEPSSSMQRIVISLQLPCKPPKDIIEAWIDVNPTIEDVDQLVSRLRKELLAERSVAPLKTRIYAFYSLRHLLAKDIRQLFRDANVTTDERDHIIVESPDMQHHELLLKTLRNRIPHDAYEVIT